jgi:DNA-binding transcriptional ArsR family regulator/uncharacterized protein YndB with AHSA1/START domain
MDAIFKALADPIRRRLLDRLNRRNGQSLRELCAGMDMARQSVTKHLAVLEAAELISVTWRGRVKLHYLNTAPISAITDGWIRRYHAEQGPAPAPLGRVGADATTGDTEFVYVTYVRTTPERMWQALTDPACTLRYWGVALYSDWQVGSRVRWRSGPDGPIEDLDQFVVESYQHRRLAYSWHTYQPGHAELFGWTDEELALMRAEPPSTVAFDIEPTGAAVKLTVTHDDFEPGSEMWRAVSGRNPGTGGWPEILANLKTFLETGDTLDTGAAVHEVLTTTG